MLILRPATKYDLESLLEMTPYYNGKIIYPFEEDIFVAENDGRVLGAISIGHRDVAFVPRDRKEDHGQQSNVKMEEVSGCWISKLYVFPEHRGKGIGTRLVKETVEYLRERGFTEAYAAINAKNRFREVSKHIFEENDFEILGSCFCISSKGNCQGTLLRKTLEPSE